MYNVQCIIYTITYQCYIPVATVYNIDAPVFTDSVML